mmetsp:Transcript_46675/g.92159  ORF Transcript_46675/g.92159 Transcript_46675/m.92159 type:complete len:116 (+) Transcript_46675:664-1011(+)
MSLRHPCLSSIKEEGRRRRKEEEEEEDESISQKTNTEKGQESPCEAHHPVLFTKDLKDEKTNIQTGRQTGNLLRPGNMEERKEKGRSGLKEQDATNDRKAAFTFSPCLPSSCVFQ